ncbi:MAG: DUF418 domain-containing protein [Deltaproteobacteria bacterium]|nr:DUF418 domain-containing protein [Deltaproteobacteria bacterium]
MQNDTTSPALRLDRIISLDILRGVAVLGILIMNIQSFSMPSAAYINPTAFGDFNGLNRWIWIFSHMLASQKFISIFSMLFGAGVVIFTENAISKEKNCALLHYRRMGWLLIFGLVHGYLMWYGDILFTYGLCGILLFVFRNISPKKLIWISFGFFAVPILLDSIFAFSMPYWPEETLQSTMQTWRPDELALHHYLAAYRGNWLEQMEIRVPGTLFMQTGLFFMQTFWRVMSMMLLGIALFRWSILSAERSKGFYLRMTIIGLLTGSLLSALGVALNFKNEWSLEFSMFLGKQFNYVGSVGTALGYVGLVMLICKSSSLKGIKRVLSLVGRMAFTNYILMTLICTFLFYGHGLGLFGSVERKFQVLIVLGTWLVMVILSSLWLKKFRYGPLEWCWRSLTYKSMVPG